ncbi:MAG: Asp23/Gls24 family envelope stress response protein [Clostridia bacterium]|nr:Asp23/Gls24 family envelope stress response protein [Clostridia bacterium]
MNENLPSNVQMDANENGSVIFATDVIATIAGLAATEVEGVASMVGTSSGGGLVDIFTRKNQNSKSLTRGVRIELGENNAVSVSLTIIVDYGSPIPEVAGNIQENVKKAIETMSGLTVTSVNVHVSGVSFEREQRTAAEIEQKQRLMLQKQETPEEPKPEPAPEPQPAPEPEPAPAPAAQEPAEEEDEGEYVLDLGDEPEDEPEEAAPGEPVEPEAETEEEHAEKEDN